MLKVSANSLTGNDRYEGLCIDIIHELSLMLGFNYEFRVQEDNNYGGIDKTTKEWTGMIRRLRDDVRKLNSHEFATKKLYVSFYLIRRLIWPYVI